MLTTRSGQIGMFDAAGLVGYARAGQLRAWLRGKLAACAGLPAVLRKRRDVQRALSADPEELWTLMDRDWIGIKRREKAFDFGSGSAGA